MQPTMQFADQRQRWHLLLTALVAVTLVASCVTFGSPPSADSDQLSGVQTANDTGVDKAPAGVSSVKAVEKVPPPPLPAGPEDDIGVSLSIDSTQSSISFTGARSKMSHTRYFRDFEGTIGLKGETPTSLRIVVDVASLVGEKSLFTWHMKSADFFDVDKFPTSTFESTRFVPSTTGRYDVTGTLTIKGIGQEVTFPTEVEVSPDQVRVEALVTVDRKRFDLAFPGLPNDVIFDDVPLHLIAVAPR